MKIDKILAAADTVALRLRDAIALLSMENRNTTDVSDMVIQDAKKALTTWEKLR